MLLMQMAMLVLMLLSGYYSFQLYIFNDLWQLFRELGTFIIVFLVPGCRKSPFRVNDKRNVLLLYLLDRHIQLQITAVARWLFRRENTFDFAGERSRGVDVVVLSTFWNTHIFRDWQRSLLGYYSHFLCFSFIRIYFFIFLTSWIFIPVTRFLVTPLLVTALLYLVTPL